MTGPHISKTTKIILTAEFLLLAYMLYVLSASLYKSYQVDKFIQMAGDENKKLEQANQTLVEDYEYYSSDAYKEKIAKQNFGLVRPGEEMIIIGRDAKTYVSEEERVTEVSAEYYKGLSNSRKWYLFFFDRERFAM